MTKKVFWLVPAILLIAMNAFAADGDLIVNGNVGVGINPQVKMDIKSSTIDNYVIKTTRSGGNQLLAGFYESSTGDGRMYLGNTGGSLVVKIDANGSSYFSGGSVGIGTADPAAKLDILYSADFWAARIRNGAGLGYGLLIDGGAGGDSYQVLRTRRYSDGTELFYVTGDGNYYFRGGFISTKESKRNTSDFNENALNLLKNIKLVNFNYIVDSADRPQRIGFIANDPEHVYDDRLTNGKTGFDVGSIVSTLIKATQELSKGMVPTGMVAFFPGTCPGGWTENPELTGTLEISGNPVNVTACQAP